MNEVTVRCNASTPLRSRFFPHPWELIPIIRPSRTILVRRYFEDWAVTAFRLFRNHGVTLFATFNEPTCAAFTGHIVGVHAPGRRGAVAAAGRVLLHMLRAHTAAYHAIRAEPGGQDVRVGLVHQMIRFEAEGVRKSV